MTYDLLYSLDATFDTPVNDHMFTLMVTPRETPFYTIGTLKTSLPLSTTTCDAFGNKIHFGYQGSFHTSFNATIMATVTFHAHYHCVDQWWEPFLYPTALTSTHHDLEPFFSLTRSLKTSYEIACCYTHAIFSSLEYKKGVTTSHCSISTLLDQKAGVCQDFAHLMIHLLRSHMIPCRYVVGFITGEGESHAWVEAFIDHQWCGFDPTHDCIITTQPYIKVAHGRDAHDCVMNKGIFRGNAIHRLNVTVSMNKRNHL